MKALQARIRKVANTDIERIVGIERSWRHLSHWSVESYYRLLTDDTFTASFVAEVEDSEGIPNIAGFVIFHVAADVSEIYNIAVDVVYSRMGVGHQLMDAAIHESQCRNATAVMLEVRKSNAAAISFYIGFGFRISGERRDYYSNPIEDAYIMEREIQI